MPTITIQCPDCGITKDVPREKHDPQKAAKAYILCPECGAGALDPSTDYFDADGRELDPLTGEPI